MRRALYNLLSNAIRHAPEHGQVRIAIRSTPQGAEVSVGNQGQAIAPDVLPRLFDRFYRADTARRHPASDGAGLGLAITRAIMQAHGGTGLAPARPTASTASRWCFRQKAKSAPPHLPLAEGTTPAVLSRPEASSIAMCMRTTASRSPLMA